MKTLILDIDNTLNTDNPADVIRIADERGYGHYSQEVWELFEERASDLTVKPHPIPEKHYKEFEKHYEEVIIISGRPEKFRDVSEKWLLKHGFYFDELILRPDNEIELSSWEVKKLMGERYGLFSDPENVVAIDDDEGVVDYYRSIGLKVFHAPHEWEQALEYHVTTGNRLTEVQKSKVKKLHKRGLSHREIASRVGCSKTSVGRILREGSQVSDNLSATDDTRVSRCRHGRMIETEIRSPLSNHLLDLAVLTSLSLALIVIFTFVYFLVN